MTDELATLPNNGAFITISQIIKAAMSLVVEAELCTLFVKFSKAIPSRIFLEEMGHKQEPKPMQTDNTTAFGVVNNNIVSQQLKSMDMRIKWLRFTIAQ